MNAKHSKPTPMFSRRQFCKVVGASALFAGLPTIAQARSPEGIRVIGIGGAGCNAVERLREQAWIAGRAEILTVNRADNYSRRHPIDLILGPSDRRLAFSCSKSDVEKIDALMEGTQRIVLVAGLGGQTGTNLIARFARSARRANVPVASVVTTPFEFEGKRNTVAKFALRHLTRLSDQLCVIDNNRVTNDLSEDVSMLHAFEYLDNLVIAEVRNVLEEDWHG